MCSGQRVLQGFNDLGTTAPELASQWNWQRNGDLTPMAVFRSTARKIWWVDDLGHEWLAGANERSNGAGCPFCSGQRILVGFNDLATRRPDVAAEWHQERNGTRTPQTVTAMNGTKVWWLCGACAHEWQTTVASRSTGTGCPACAGQVVRLGVNDLAGRRPDIAATWATDLNGATRACEVAVYSNRKFWWRCDAGHPWLSTVNNRSHGQGCPECAEHGFNPSKPSSVYLISNDALKALKIGITNDGTGRLSAFQREGWVTIHLEHFDRGEFAARLEHVMKRWWFKELGLMPYLGAVEMRKTGGWTETVELGSVSTLECVRRLVDERRALVGEMPH